MKASERIFIDFYENEPKIYKYQAQMNQLQTIFIAMNYIVETDLLLVIQKYKI